jgi:hypothetical protein
VLAVRLGVVTVKEPIAPDPLDRVTELVAVIVPVPVMPPDPDAATDVVGPLMLALMAMLLIDPVLVKLKLLAAVIGFVTVIAVVRFAESIRVKLAPLDEPLPVIACVSVNVTTPPVLAVTLGVVSVSDPIAPEPELRFTDVVPVTVPVPVMVPSPEAAIVSAVPDTLALIAMLAPDGALNKNVPLAVMVLLTVIAVPLEAVSVRLKLAAVDGPQQEIATLSVTVMLPEEVV